MSDLTRKAARGTILHLGAQICLAASSYIVAMILARQLGPSAYGVYGLVYSVLFAVETLGRFGVPQAAAKLSAERVSPDTTIDSTSLTISTVSNLVLFAAFWLLAPVLSGLFGLDDGGRLFRIAAIDIPFYGLYIALFFVLNGRRRFLLESVSVALYGLARLVGIILLVWIGPTVVGALVINILTSVVALAFTGLCVGRAPLRPSFAHCRPIVLLALPIALVSIGTLLLPSVDLWVLSAAGATVSEATRGFYVAAGTVARMPVLVANGLSAALLPSIASALGSGDRALAERALRGAVRFMIIVLVPACVAIAVDARAVMALLFSGTYADAGRLLAIMIFAQGFCMTFVLVLCSVAIGAGAPRAAGTRMLAVLLPGILVEALLVQTLGAEGAALGALLTLAATMLVLARLVRGLVGSLMEAGVLPRVLLATAIVTVPLYLAPVDGATVLPELMLAGIVYLALLPLLGLVRLADIEPFLPARLRLRAG